jgi:general secretion pathway protein G
MTETSDPTAYSRIRRAARRDRRGGFTLVELLVVLVILSLVMGLVGPRVLSYLVSSREKAAKLQIESFAGALDLFYLDNGRYPTTQEGLDALVKRPAAADRWSGPYIQQPELPADPWGNPYEYRVPGTKAPYSIVSLGSDGQRGGTDDGTDISNE